jgi:hypothetical protein
MGAFAALFSAVLGGVTGNYAPSPYFASTIVLFAMALASRK